MDEAILALGLWSCPIDSQKSHHPSLPTPPSLPLPSLPALSRPRCVASVRTLPLLLLSVLLSLRSVLCKYSKLLSGNSHWSEYCFLSYVIEDRLRTPAPPPFFLLCPSRHKVEQFALYSPDPPPSPPLIHSPISSSFGAIHK